MGRGRTRVLGRAREDAEDRRAPPPRRGVGEARRTAPRAGPDREAVRLLDGFEDNAATSHALGSIHLARGDSPPRRRSAGAALAVGDGCLEARAGRAAGRGRGRAGRSAGRRRPAGSRLAASLGCDVVTARAERALGSGGGGAGRPAAVDHLERALGAFAGSRCRWRRGARTCCWPTRWRRRPGTRRSARPRRGRGVRRLGAARRRTPPAPPARPGRPGGPSGPRGLGCSPAGAGGARAAGRGPVQPGDRRAPVPHPQDGGASRPNVLVKSTSGTGPRPRRTPFATSTTALTLRARPLRS